jgi:hypothetical protein
MNQEKINYRVARDFGETFNVSIKFLRQNYKLLIQSLILLAGPFILITAIIGAFYQANAIETMSNPGNKNIFSQFGWNYLLFIIAGIVSNLMIIGVVYSFMIEYADKGHGNFQLNDVAKRLTSNIGNILSVFFSLTFLILLFLGAIIGIFIAIGTSLPWLAVLLGFICVIGLLILFPPLMWQLSVVYMVKMTDNENVFDSYGKTRSVMKGNFWWTWVIVICSSLAIGVISFVFSLPQVIYQMVEMFSRMRGDQSEVSIVFLIVATICTFCTSILYSLLYLVNAFHYFSLNEKKEGTGLMERINDIGQKPEQNADRQY